MLANNAPAAQASGNIPAGDCNVLNHFLTASGLSSNYIASSNEGAYTFGHFYVLPGDTNYYCTEYGSTDIAVNVNQTSVYSNRRLVCPCQGKIES